MASSGQKELRRSWPHTAGLTAGTEKQQGEDHTLQPSIASLVPQRLKQGFSNG